MKRRTITRKDPPGLFDGPPAPGEYAPLVNGAGREVNAMIGCPGCGRRLTVASHVVDEDGTVEPSLDCPFGDCGFHRRVRLDDWRPGREEAGRP